MATLPDKEEPQPTRAQRAVKAVAAPSLRIPATLVLGAALAALAPFPVDALAVAAWMVVALDVARRR